jgi:cytochrome P450
VYRDEDYLRCILHYALDVNASVDALFRWPAALRPLVRWWLPELRRIRALVRDMTRVMAPHVAALAAANAQGKSTPPPRGKGKDNEHEHLLTWVMSKSPPTLVADPHYQALTQLRVAFASIHTTSVTLCHLLWDLAARPEYVAPLRDELAAVASKLPRSSMASSATPATPKDIGGDGAGAEAEAKASAGANEGTGANAGGSESLAQRLLTREAIARLTKLDSFLKESQRANCMVQVGFFRKVGDRDVVLHDGTVLPAGARIGVANAIISRQLERWERGPAVGDGNGPGPQSIVQQRAQRGRGGVVGLDEGGEVRDEFDGFRFDRLRREAEAAAAAEKAAGQRGGGDGAAAAGYAFTTTSVNSLHFGHGKHACPGRFFVAVELKLLMAHILERYDLRLMDDEPCRPRNIESNTSMIPDPAKKILIRKRRDL